MAERQVPQLTEQAPVVPELTTKHWQLIASLEFDDPKINEYALAKAEGRIDEELEPFIGNRHWKEIVKRIKPFKEGIKGFIAKRLDAKKHKLAVELALVAETAQNTFTIDDIFIDLSSKKRYVDNEWHEHYTVTETANWDQERKQWRYTEHTKGTVLNYSKGYHSDVNDFYERWGHELVTDKILFDLLPINETEIGHPSAISLDQIIEMAKTNIPEHVLIERSRKLKGKGANIRGWEKPIPQAA